MVCNEVENDGDFQRRTPVSARRRARVLGRGVEQDIVNRKAQ